MNKPFKVKIKKLSFYPFLEGKGREFKVIRNEKFPSYFELRDFPPFVVREIDCKIVTPEIPWYEDIPKEGVWCKVWDAEEDRIAIDKVTFYNEKECYSFTGIYSIWKNAKPFSQEFQTTLNNEIGN